MNPASGEVLEQVPITTVQEVEQAVLSAEIGLDSWGDFTLEKRIQILKAFSEALESEKSALSRLISLEQGKVLSESLAEVVDAVHRVQYFCREVPEVLSSRTIDLPGMHCVVEHQPVGVVGAIKPWNFPLGIPLWTIAPALLAGNTVVFKPSELTPLIGAEILRLFRESGLPDFALQLVQGADEVGRALSRSKIRMVGFVGSQEVGSDIMREASKDMKRLSLEMGGKDPMLVLQDADVDDASSAAVNGAFKNCGQVCCSIERVYVHRSILKPFLESVIDKTRALKIGPGIEEGSQVGPLVSHEQRERVRSLFEDAVRCGASVHLGGKPVPGPGFFIEPAVLSEISQSAKIYSSETFGPILQIEPFEKEEEAIRLANQFPYGLTATVWSKDLQRAERVVRKLHAGTRAINQNIGSKVELPWGGVKSSGYGRMLSSEGILEFTETITTRRPFS